jgi:hypothetical protein
MLKRLYFPLVILFWGTMNVLLWRSEMGAGRETGNEVPTAVVWQRVLTAPDDSSLQVLCQGRRAGYSRWAANVGEEVATGKVASEDGEPEGRVRRLMGYTLDFDGNVLVGEGMPRLRCSWRAEFATNQAWRKMSLRLVVRPNIWEFRADAATETLTMLVEGSDGRHERTFKFAELGQPEALLLALGNPLAGEWLRELMPTPPRAAATPHTPALGLAWEARNDWLTIGHTKVRVYRLQARLLGRHQVVVIVSRVGEILRVELPNGWRLVNEALFEF